MYTQEQVTAAVAAAVAAALAELGADNASAPDANGNGRAPKKARKQARVSKPTCTGVKADGSPCGSPIVGKDGLCRHHRGVPEYVTGGGKRVATVHANFVAQARMLAVDEHVMVGRTRRRNLNRAWYDAGGRWDTGAWKGGVNDTYQLGDAWYRWVLPTKASTGKVQPRFIERIA